MGRLVRAFDNEQSQRDFRALRERVDEEERCFRSADFGEPRFRRGPERQQRAVPGGAHRPVFAEADRNQKYLLNAYLEGRPKSDYPPGKTIVVRADEVACRISDVDITAKSCDLKFGAQTVSPAGRKRTSSMRP